MIEATLKHEHVMPLRNELARNEARGEAAADDYDRAMFQRSNH
jgi:hypothetical protein